MASEVVFHPFAADDLDALDDMIAHDSPRLAYEFVGRIRQFCNTLSDFPERGRLRRELGQHIRTLSFEGRVVIAYRLDGPVVVVLRIFYAGRNYGPESFSN